MLKIKDSFSFIAASCRTVKFILLLTSNKLWSMTDRSYRGLQYLQTGYDGLKKVIVYFQIYSANI